MNQPTAKDQVLRAMTGYCVSQALYAAARLDLAERLAAGPATAADLARACGALPDRLERLLRALSGEGIFRRRDDGRWENTETSSELRSSVTGSAWGPVTMLGEEQYAGWSKFLDCLKTPKTAFELHYGEPVFGWYAKHPEQTKTFNRAMRDYSATQIPAIVAAYDASPFRKIVDVGGGHGTLLTALLERAPSARGVVFDLEQGLGAARAAGLDRNPRVDLVAGDFFRAVPAGGDLYVLKFILHDWDDAQCATILRHVRAGLAPGGRVLVAEHLVGPHNEPDAAKWMDLHMMAMPGGRERTRDEFASLFAEAGLRLTREIPTAATLWLLEASA